MEGEDASGPHHKGKASVEPSYVVMLVVEPRGFMTDTQAHPIIEEGWQVVSRHRQWRLATRAPSPPPIHRPVLACLVGRYFNCLYADHGTIACKFPSRCLCCHREGHKARSYKHPRSPDVAELPLRPPRLTSGKQLWLTSVVVINTGVGNVALAELRSRHSRSHSSTPSGQNGIPTLEGSPPHNS
jgi:hypothetical protein